MFRYGRFPDGTSALRSFLRPTPAAANDATTAPMILNEYNGVDADRVPQEFGKRHVLGSGRRERRRLVRTRRDPRPPRCTGLASSICETTRRSEGAAVHDDPLWSDLRSGTIITVAEDLADDVSFDPAPATGGSTSRPVPGRPAVHQRQQLRRHAQQLAADDQGRVGRHRIRAGGGGNQPDQRNRQRRGLQARGRPGVPSRPPTPITTTARRAPSATPNRYASGTVQQNFDLLRCGGQDCLTLTGECGIGTCDPTTGSC